MLKLNQTAFANSMAILTAAFYLLLYLINLIDLDCSGFCLTLSS